MKWNQNYLFIQIIHIPQTLYDDLKDSCVTFSEFQLFSGWFICTIKWEGRRPIWTILTVVGNLLHHQWRVNHTGVSQMSLKAGLNYTTGIRIRKFILSFPWTSEWIPRSSFLCFNDTSATLHFATFLIAVGRRKSSKCFKATVAWMIAQRCKKFQIWASLCCI